jgi:dienelactone hydrolase
MTRRPLAFARTEGSPSGPWLGAVAALLALALGACEPTVREGVHRAVDRVGRQDDPSGAFREQHWFIPYPSKASVMAATLWSPRGAGPFPLVVVNHASSQDPDDRTEDPTERYRALAYWFVRRGYAVVLPVRLGHGLTGGAYLEDQGGCDDADYRNAGRMTAVSIDAAIAYMTTQSFIRKEGVIVVGQSAGGWGALALAATNPPAVRAIIVFSPGRGGRANGNPNINCAPDQLVDATGEFGRNARLPVLWLNARNDTYFNPELSHRMIEAFRAQGGRVEDRLLAPVGDEGHFLFRSPEAWGPVVESFLGRGS